MKEIHSCLYSCSILHVRNFPRPHRFLYRYFMFCLDLDEVEALSERSLFFGTTRSKLFRFVPKDFFLASNAKTAVELKKEICDYAASNGNFEISRIEIIGHLRTFGYAYNPACFYFCYDAEHRLVCSILEVTNTFRERKIFFVKSSEQDSEKSVGSEAKLFYVSPFVAFDSVFEFNFHRPSNQLFIQIDSNNRGSTIVHSVLKGQRVLISDSRLLLYFLRYPLIGARVMFSIHFQALVLFLKRVSHFKKHERHDPQKGGLS